tara:strand:- start:255 stop:701 length:447 start_codon:yes stop_codon:yes gene_type:complete
MDKIIIFFISFILLTSNTNAESEYYLTLRNDKVNLRLGPSFKHPIKLIYKKKFLPVLIKDESGNFKKITDHQNNSGWIHITQLSKRKAALNNQEKSVIFQKPSKYSKPLAVAEKGRLFLIKKCKKNWCKIKTENFSGWIEKEYLNGRL